MKMARSKRTGKDRLTITASPVERIMLNEAHVNGALGGWVIIEGQDETHYFLGAVLEGGSTLHKLSYPNDKSPCRRLEYKNLDASRILAHNEIANMEKVSEGLVKVTIGASL